MSLLDELKRSKNNIVIEALDNADNFGNKRDIKDVMFELERLIYPNCEKTVFPDDFIEEGKIIYSETEYQQAKELYEQIFQEISEKEEIQVMIDKVKTELFGR